jgi:hypothetical protein
MGIWARETLELKTGKVMGVTSKGVFLLFDQRTAFVSSTNEKSPFVIHVDESHQLKEISNGQVVLASASEISFPANSTSIDLQRAEEWTPPIPKTLSTMHAERVGRINELVIALNKVNPSEQALPNREDIQADAALLQSGFQQQNLGLCITTAEKWLGVGGGLTPSGDDLLVGFLLYHTRLNQTSPLERPFVTELGKTLTERAYAKTTSLSANRIEVACRGWAEGIFLEVIDHLFNQPVGIPERVVERLLDFGHSSGVETIYGIALAASLR